MEKLLGPYFCCALVMYSCGMVGRLECCAGGGYLARMEAHREGVDCGGMSGGLTKVYSNVVVWTRVFVLFIHVNFYVYEKVVLWSVSSKTCAGKDMSWSGTDGCDTRYGNSCGSCSI